MTSRGIEGLAPFFSEPDGVLNVVVETPANSQLKYDYDPASGLFMLDRPIHSSLRYPFDYGFIPNTLAPDGDPVDAVLMISHPTFPGCLVRARAVGVMDMEDEGGRDEKILCVASRDPRAAHIIGIDDVAPHHLKELEHFFVHIKDLEQGKWARVHGFRDKAQALQVVRAGFDSAVRGGADGVLSTEVG